MTPAKVAPVVQAAGRSEASAWTPEGGRGMKCIIVCCPWNASGGAYCAAHAYWVRVVMADDRYRTEPVPPCPLVCPRRER